MFRRHAQKMLGKLLLAGFHFTNSMLILAPPECAQQAAAAMALADEAAPAAAAKGMFIIHSTVDERDTVERKKTAAE